MVPNWKVITFGAGQAGVQNEEDEVMALALPTESGYDCQKVARLLVASPLMLELLGEVSAINDADERELMTYEFDKRVKHISDWIDTGRAPAKFAA